MTVSRGCGTEWLFIKCYCNYHLNQSIEEDFSDVMDDLDLYYAHANEELYRLIEELGSDRTVGWEGKWDPRHNVGMPDDEKAVSLPVVFRFRVGNIAGGGSSRAGTISRMSMQSAAGGGLKANLTARHESMRIQADNKGHMIVK